MVRWSTTDHLYLSTRPPPVSVPTCQRALPLAIIVLNQPIYDRSVFERLWSRASVRYCADGGANRVYDEFFGPQGRLPGGEVAGGKDFPFPHLIEGDLDSLRDDVRQFFEARGVRVIRTPSQYATDLMKCIARLDEHEALLSETSATSTSDPDAGSVQQHTLAIHGGLSGRLDQTMHTLHVLLGEKLRKGRTRTFVVGDGCVAWVLDEGEHTLEIDRTLLGPTCGLLPVGFGEAVMSTTGLEWNLDNQPSALAGDLFSTSNHVVDDIVTIKTDKPIVWTVELRSA